MSKAERKAFRSQMWAFRRDPASLTPEEQRALEGLFEKIPKLIHVWTSPTPCPVDGKINLGRYIAQI